MKTRLFNAGMMSVLLTGNAVYLWGISPFPSFLKKSDILLFTALGIVGVFHKAWKSRDDRLAFVWNAVLCAFLIFALTFRHGEWNAVAVFFVVFCCLFPGAVFLLQYLEENPPRTPPPSA
jgi:hypothetical protein